MKKMSINNKLYNVVTMEDYRENQELYNPKFTAIEYQDSVLPLRSKIETEPGIYYQTGNMCYDIKKPNEEQQETYCSNNIIDYTKVSNMSELLQTNKLVRNIENDILTNKDNIFEPVIGPEDTPEMIALKRAIKLKQIDIKQYEPRFKQYQNDIRIFKGGKITLSKLINMCDIFDLNAELILTDKPNCANPMNSQFKIDLTTCTDEEGK